ncbi:hypothetical protein Sango_3104900 [Sesamum angolense]|uniref:Disease resistance R13L4/SHOC-2-like LRR domain-containing protein n=1 Tax=Sesamum angolense TaxID=2727404 RepID=A0AAE1T840_9LAMI|nr:hypothetical protein Sango_3104900 [Sesamum angolense]
MKPLTEAECSKLLREKANFDNAELQILGKTISELSGGSPLIASILGHSLKTVDVAARDQLLHELDYYLTTSQISKGETQVLEIRRRKTTLMKSVRNTLEKLAMKRLVDVQEDNVSMTRMYKSCRLHDQIRELCISKGLDEEFFKIVDFKSEKELGPSTRRLAIYLSKYGDGDAIRFRSHDTRKKIRSLLIFDAYDSHKKSTWPSEINDLKEFSKLRALDFDGVDFRARKLPRGMDKLVLLRYLSFRGCCMENFPPSISKFPCLETLDLRVKDCNLAIPDVLSTMKRLRHLYFPIMYRSDSSNKLKLLGLDRLEILVNFDTGACNVDDIFHLENLQVLAAISDGNPKDLEAIIKCLDKKSADLHHSSLNIRNFDCYTKERVAIFTKVLECKSLHSLHIEGPIGHLPKNVAISRNFTEMVFDGYEMAFAASTFPNLRVLKLLNLEYLENLTFEKGALPKLSTLVIDKCGELQKVSMPKELHDMLQRAQESNGDDVYLVEPFPTIRTN